MSYLEALELINTAEAYTPSRPHALTLQRFTLQKSALQIFADQASAESKHVVGWACKPLQRE